MFIIGVPVTLKNQKAHKFVLFMLTSHIRFIQIKKSNKVKMQGKNTRKRLSTHSTA